MLAIERLKYWRNHVALYMKGPAQTGSSIDHHKLVNLITVGLHPSKSEGAQVTVKNNKLFISIFESWVWMGVKYIELINYRKCGLRGRGTGHGAFLRSHASLRAGSCCRRRWSRLPPWLSIQPPSPDTPWWRLGIRRWRPCWQPPLCRTPPRTMYL